MTVANSGYHVEFGNDSRYERLVFDQEYCTQSNSDETWPIKELTDESGLSNLVKTQQWNIAGLIAKYLNDCRVYHFHDTGETAKFKRATPVDACSYLYNDASQISDGTARFICMATLFMQPPALRPSTIIIDEPELGLHPAALEVLSDIVKSAAKTSQIICSTQSVTFANQFAPEDFIVVEQQKGASIFKHLDPAALEHWLEDYQMGDLWNMNVVGGRPQW